MECHLCQGLLNLESINEGPLCGPSMQRDAEVIALSGVVSPGLLILVPLVMWIGRLLRQYLPWISLSNLGGVNVFDEGLQLLREVHLHVVQDVLQLHQDHCRHGRSLSWGHRLRPRCRAPTAAS